MQPQPKTFITRHNGHPSRSTHTPLSSSSHCSQGGNSTPRAQGLGIGIGVEREATELDAPFFNPLMIDYLEGVKTAAGEIKFSGQPSNFDGTTTLSIETSLRIVPIICAFNSR